jgi:hypothetical protein
MNADKLGWRSHAGLLAACIAAVVLLHLPQLKLPYYWDEAGYYVPAARDLYLTGDPIPRSTHTNPHPPLLAAYLAASWKLFGFSPLVTRLAMAALAGATLYALLLLAPLAASPAAGLWAALWTLTTPVFFAQSTLAHLDIAAAPGLLLSVYFYLRRRLAACVLAGTLLCLVRETGVAVVLTLAAFEFYKQKRDRRNGRQEAGGRRQGMGDCLLPPASCFPLLLPLLPLATWFLYLRYRTGLWLGDAYFANYNVFRVLHPARWALQFTKRAYQLGFADFHWVATALIVAAVWRNVVTGRRPVRQPGGLSPLAAVMAVYLALLSVFGAPLHRYLLPIVPLFLLLAARAAFQLHFRGRNAVLALLPVAFVVCWFWNPPYMFAHEDNLSYADYVRLHKETAPLLEDLPPGTRILTAWPASDELSRPWLGYVRRSLATVEVAEFTRPELERVAPDSFDIVFLFSRESNPQWFDRFPRLARLEAHFFGFQRQAPPEWIEQRFALRRVVHIEFRGQWVEIWAKSHIPDARFGPNLLKMGQFAAIP